MVYAETNACRTDVVLLGSVLDATHDRFPFLRTLICLNPLDGDERYVYPGIR